MTSLRLIVSDGTEQPDINPFVASFVGIADQIESGDLAMDQAILVAVVDGAVTYAPIGTVTLVEAVGLLELASRKVERDMLR